MESNIKIALTGIITSTFQKNLKDFTDDIQDKLKDILLKGYNLEFIRPDGQSLKIPDQTSYDSAMLLKIAYVKLVINVEEQNALALSDFEVLDNVDATEDQPEVERTEPAKEEFKKADSGPLVGHATLDSCFLCKPNQPDKNCAICKGTGKLRKELQDHVENLVKQGITEFNAIRKKQLKIEDDMVLKSQIVANFANAGKSKIVHSGFKCSACGVTPITGIRFACTVCHNTNFCESCEAIISHNHPVVKYRVLASPTGNSKAPEGSPKYCSKCMSASIKENQVVEPGQTISIKWKLVNTGDINWPKETILHLDTESSASIKMKAKPIGEVPPGKAVMATADLTAPKEVGKCVAFFQLKDSGTNVIFGQKFWVDLNVKGNEPQEIDYTDNMLKLAQMYETTDPELILKLLKENKNSTEVVANLLISQAH